MRHTDVEFLLVGGGVASAQCAAELRRRGAEGSIVLVGRESDPPYDRPPLSKEYLRGSAERADALVHSEDWYTTNGIELLTSKSVIRLDLKRRTAELQGKQELGFKKALIATGAMVNILRCEGAQLEGIHYLRSFGNSDSIRADIADAEHVVLIGGSYIGTEVAASLVEMGLRCTIVLMEDVVLSTTLGKEVGRYFDDLLRSKGIAIVAGEQLEKFQGKERVEGIVTTSGLEVACDAVVIGAGVKPDVMLAQRSGLEVADGIVCDAGLETSVAGIFAAGDCCSYESEIHGRRLRVEHTDVAFHQGRHAAAGMLGDKRPYQVVPYFYSDLADWSSMECVGPAREWDRIVFRGDRDGGEFSAWYLHRGSVAAALSVGRGEDLIEARKLIASRSAIVDPDVLADPYGDLSSIAA